MVKLSREFKARKKFITESQLRHGKTYEEAAEEWRAIEIATALGDDFEDMPPTQVEQTISDYRAVEKYI